MSNAVSWKVKEFAIQNESLTCTIYPLWFSHDVFFSSPSTQLSMKSNHSLNDLKTEITESKSICKEGPILSKHQRLFHLGRELKTGNRTLSSLGIGRLSTIIHLFCTQPQRKSLKINNGDSTHNTQEVKEVIDLNDDDKSVSNFGTKRTDRNQSKRSREVINLLDDSSDDDSDDIEILDRPSPKRPRSESP
jgi:hypothetical protein